MYKRLAHKILEEYHSVRILKKEKEKRLNCLGDVWDSGVSWEPLQFLKTVQSVREDTIQSCNNIISAKGDSTTL